MSRTFWVLRPLLTLALTWAFADVPVAQRQPRPSDEQIRRAVVERLADKEIGCVTVIVEQGIVTLRGLVPTLWIKQKAVEYASHIDGVVSVASELTIPLGEDHEVDAQIAGDVSMRLRRYVFFSIFDDAEVDVHHGIVTLTGRVTMPYKAEALADLASHVPGVQDVKNKIQTLPPSQFDDQLRYAVARQIYGDPMFAEYAVQVTPPIHIIVEHGKVTLTGAVRSTVERRTAESIARSTFGVMGVTNKLHLEIED